MTILGIIGLIFIIKEAGVLAVLNIIKPLFKLFNTINDNLTLKGIAKQFIKEEIYKNYSNIIFICALLIVLFAIIALVIKNIKIQKYNIKSGDNYDKNI